IVVCSVDDCFRRRGCPIAFQVLRVVAVVRDRQFVQQAGVKDMGFDQRQVVIVLVVAVWNVRGRRRISAAPLIGVTVPEDVRGKTEPVVGAEILVNPADVGVSASEQRVISRKAPNVSDRVWLICRLWRAQREISQTRSDTLGAFLLMTFCSLALT